jgi:hypothetical protein
MMSRKKAIEITREAEQTVYTSIEDIAQLIELHAKIGMSDMEVFIEKASAKKFIKVLDRKKFYSRITEFKSLEHECRLYISWISNL